MLRTIEEDDSSHYFSVSGSSIVKPLDENSNIVKKGYLNKLGNKSIIKKWKKRLFILTLDGMVRYYNNKNRVINIINLALCKNICIDSESCYKQSWVITLITPDRDYILSCENEKERQSWIYEIQQTLQKIQKNQVFLLHLNRLESSQLSNNNYILAEIQEKMDNICQIKLLSLNCLQISIIKTQHNNHNIISINEIESKIRLLLQTHSDIKIQGWVFKKSNHYNQWKKRWLVLKWNKLEWYINPNDKKPKHIIDLNNIIGVGEILNNNSKYNKCLEDHVFEVQINNDQQNDQNQRYIFAINDEHNLIQWVNCIHDYIDNSNKDNLYDQISNISWTCPIV